MCAWSTTWPDGSQSVKTNQATGAANTTYIKTEMNKDHYWDNSANNDGHHHQVQMTQTGTSAVPTDVALATGMDGAIFLKCKSAAEVNSGNQDVNPFFINNKAVGTPGVTQLMQLLGIRAMANFSVNQTTFAITVNYEHNLGSSAIVRTSLGRYTATFNTALPSENYFVLGGAFGAGSADSNIIFSVQNTAGGAATSVKSTTSFKFNFRTGNNTITDPLQCYFIVFGG